MGIPRFTISKWKKCKYCGREFRGQKAEFCPDCIKKHTIKKLEEMIKEENAQQ